MSRQQKNKKPRVYDLNQDPEEIIVSEPKKSVSKKSRKYDFNDIIDDDLQQETAPIKLDNETQSSLQLNALPQTNRQSTLLPLNSIANQTINTGNLPTPIQIIANEPSSINQPFDTIEDITYTEDLLLGLFQGNFSEELTKLIQQLHFRGNDKQARQRTLVFLSFYNFIDGQVKIEFDKNGCEVSLTSQLSSAPWNEMEYLKQWISTMLCSRFISQNQLNLKNLPPQLIYFVRNKLLYLAKRYQKQKKWTQAFLLANSSDQIAFAYMNDISSHHQLRDQLNIITVDDVGLMKKSSWPVELGIVLNFYFRKDETTKDQLIQHLTKIYTRYFLSQISFLSCQLLAVILFFEDDKQIVQETHLRNILRMDGKLNQLKLVFLLYLLKPKIQRFPTAVLEIVHILLKTIKNPSIFIEIIKFAQVPLQRLPQTFKLLMNQNPNFIMNYSDCLKRLKESIEQKRERLDENDRRYGSIMHNWVICTQLLELHQKQQHFAFLQYYIQHYRQMQQNIIPQSDIIEALKNTLTNYELACNYKKQKILSFYSILEHLQYVIYQPLREIVQGCMAFIQFKQGVFDLRKKLSALCNLVEQMEQIVKNRGLTASSNSGCEDKQQIFLKYISKTITQQLKRPDGRIFIQQMCQNVASVKRDSFIEQIPKGKQNPAARKQFVESQIYKLLAITRWNSTLQKQIIINLVVRQ